MRKPRDKADNVETIDETASIIVTSRENDVKEQKITVMITIIKLIIGGAEQQFLEIVKGLDKKKFRVIVVSLYAGGDLEPAMKQVPDIEYICLERKKKYDFSILFTMFRLMRKYHANVVQPFLTPATFYTILPAILCRIPVRIVTERGNVRFKKGRGYSLYLRMEDFLTRFVDWVIPNSKSGGEYLITRGINPKKIKVIYNGINLDRLVPDPEKTSRIKLEMGLQEGELVVGISASLTDNKDHFTFLKAARKVADTNPHVKFAILGDGPLNQTLRNMANDLELDSKVIFLGNQTEVASYLAAFDIACLSSAKPEGCSNSILEAMALGKPVVATDVGGNKELVTDGETGWIVPSQDPSKLAEAMLKCLEKPDQARKMGAHGKEVIMSEFSLQRMISDYERLYEMTLKQKHHLKIDAQ